MEQDNKLQVFLKDEIKFYDKARKSFTQGLFLRSAPFAGVWITDGSEEETLIHHDEFFNIKNLDSDDELLYSFSEIEFNEFETFEEFYQ